MNCDLIHNNAVAATETQMNDGPIAAPELAPLGGQTERAPSGRHWQIAGIVAGVLQRCEFGDLLLYLYLVTVARQCFWLVPNNRIAWALTCILAGFVWFWYVATKEVGPRSSKQIWLVAGLPLFFVYAMRVVFLDVSFDVLNYHLFLSERALRGPLLLPGDFFPTPAPYNPAPQMLTGIFRFYLGYRLGTIVNFLALLWTAQVLDKLLRPYVRNNWHRAIAVLLCLLAEHLLFEINNYMVDLIALPLTLEATRLALIVDRWENYRRRLVRIGFLFGLALTMKLTNAAMVAPIMLGCAYFTFFKFRPRLQSLATTVLLTLIAMVAPLLPYSIFIYGETRSPLFPVYNGIFKSPYWPLSGIWDPRWGPRGIREVLLWPLLLRSKPERLSEMSVYSGRVTIAVIIIVLCLFVWRRRMDATTLALCVMALLSALLWSLTTGYIRYGLHLEVLSGVLIVILAAQLWNSSWSAQGLRRTLATLLMFALVAQAALASRYIFRKEWSMRHTVFSDSDDYWKSTQYLMHDHSLRKYLNDEERAMYDGVEVWVVSGMKTVGFEALLNGKVPFISVRTPEYFTPAGIEKFNDAFDQAEGKKVWSLCLAEDFDETLNLLPTLGLEQGQVKPVEIPFFSPLYRVPMYFFEVKRIHRLDPKEGRLAPTNPLAMPDGSYRATISAIEAPDVFSPGEKRKVIVQAINAGSGVWPWQAPQGWMNVVTVGNRWLNADGLGVVSEVDGRTALPHDLKPGDKANLVLIVTAPQSEGQYVLEIDMVHEGVTWFSQRGSQTLRWPVTVRKLKS